MNITRKQQTDRYKKVGKENEEEEERGTKKRSKKEQLR